MNITEKAIFKLIAGLCHNYKATEEAARKIVSSKFNDKGEPDENGKTLTEWIEEAKIVKEKNKRIAREYKNVQKQRDNKFNEIESLQQENKRLEEDKILLNKQIDQLEQTKAQLEELITGVKAVLNKWNLGDADSVLRQLLTNIK